MELLKQLLAIESIAENPQKLLEIIQYVKSHFEEFSAKTNIPLVIKTYESNGKPSIVISTSDKLDYKVILCGHLDVVPGTPAMFDPYEENGKLYARGSSDMKGADYAMIEGFKTAVTQNPNLDAALMLTTDEEIGGFDGVQYLVEEIGYRCNVAFVPDDGDDWSICTDQKGLFHMKVFSRGIGGHGARPWVGKNAAVMLINAFTDIKNAFESQWGEPSKENSWIPTVNLGLINSGNATNKIADAGEMRLDIRYPASVDSKEIQRIFEEAFKKWDCSYDVYITATPTHIELTNPFVEIWEEIVTTKIGKQITTERTEGSSDGRHFAAAGIPVLFTKPSCSDDHIDNEWIDIKGLQDFCTAISEWLIKVA